jgi:hypothetical protein
MNMHWYNMINWLKDRTHVLPVIPFKSRVHKMKAKNG